jgi:hypothetical protein
VFFTFVAGPMFFDPALEVVLPKPEDGVAARFLIGRFTAFQLSCACIALITMALGWRLEGGKFPRAQGLLLGAAVASTDAAATFLLVQQSGVNLRRKLQARASISGLPDRFRSSL